MAVFPKNGNKSSKNSEKQKLRRTSGEALTGIDRISRFGNRNLDGYLSGVRLPADLVALRARAAALLRNRSIWPRGSVTQISPIHSSFTPVIGLALKLVRLTEVGDFPRSIVFR
jgi:hypothetical protein